MVLSEEERDLLDTGPRRGLRTNGRGGGGNGGRRRTDRVDARSSAPAADRRRHRRRTRPDRGNPRVLGTVDPDEVPQVAVPAVDGKSAAEARTILETSGFKVKRLGESSLDIDAGKVTRTAPGAGIKADDGSEVTCTSRPDRNGYRSRPARQDSGRGRKGPGPAPDSPT